MKSNPILTVLSAAAIGFLIGISFPVQITPKVFPLFSLGDGNCTVSGATNSPDFQHPSEIALLILQRGLLCCSQMPLQIQRYNYSQLVGNY